MPARRNDVRTYRSHFTRAFEERPALIRCSQPVVARLFNSSATDIKLSSSAGNALPISALLSRNPEPPVCSAAAWQCAAVAVGFADRWHPRPKGHRGNPGAEANHPSSRSAGLFKVETRTVPSGNPLKSLAGATGLEPATSGVTGRAKVEQYQRFSNFCRSKNVQKLEMAVRFSTSETGATTCSHCAQRPEAAQTAPDAPS
jgi:hypothetical protein